MFFQRLPHLIEKKAGSRVDDALNVLEDDPSRLEDLDNLDELSEEPVRLVGHIACSQV